MKRFLTADPAPERRSVPSLGGQPIKSEFNDPPPLDYAAPASRAEPSATSPVPAVLGTVAGLFGALMLFYGVGAILGVLRDRRRLDAEDLFEVVMINVIGGLSAAFAVRWIRSAVKNTGGE